MEWKIQIEKVVNGYIVYHSEEDSDNQVKTVFSYQRDETVDVDTACMKEVLLFVKEHFGVLNSKHNQYNLIVGFTEDGERIYNKG